jgi:hypothetical protein
MDELTDLNNAAARVTKQQRRSNRKPIQRLATKKQNLGRVLASISFSKCVATRGAAPNARTLSIP